MVDEADKNTTDFGFEKIPLDKKTARVAEVFRSVATRYDQMNDLMSLGIHRVWKHFAVSLCAAKEGDVILDLAGGSGDLTRRLRAPVGKSGRLILADINESMLAVGKQRLLDAGLYQNTHFVQADAENLPFADHLFDCVIMGFGLRNVTDKQQALRSTFRVLKPGGRFIILEFSHPTSSLLQKIYDAYSFNVLPKLGKWMAHDEKSYRYLAESIRRHPDQETLRHMMQQAGFSDCDFHNVTGGIVAVHRGYKY